MTWVRSFSLNIREAVGYDISSWQGKAGSAIGQHFPAVATVVKPSENCFWVTTQPEQDKAFYFR